MRNIILNRVGLRRLKGNYLSGLQTNNFRQFNQYLNQEKDETKDPEPIRIIKSSQPDQPTPLSPVELMLKTLTAPLFFLGCFTVQKNNVAVYEYFGKYQGIKEEGLRFNLPGGFRRHNVFIGLKTLEITQSRVNDLDGKPIILSAIANYQVIDPVKYIYNIDSKYILNQISTVVKKIATEYTFDQLRAENNEVTNKAREEAQKLVDKAGIKINNLYFTDLNYTPEIAQSMLVVQQARAHIEARKAISEAAVMIAKDVIDRTKDLNLDKDARDRMIVNLVTTITSQTNSQHVITL